MRHCNRICDGAMKEELRGGLSSQRWIGHKSKVFPLHPFAVPPQSLELNAVLHPSVVLPHVMNDSAFQEALFEFLPPEHRTSEGLRATLLSPQFAQQVDLYGAAASSTPPESLLVQLGIPPPGL